ncbi:MAG TPA: translocation/assembly module TamB domain-containing protein [Polyangiaceae bacterium]|nr:translocation/assembly module TamB domain-containing protein [Polyangiaceae bacterium]
MRTSNHKWLKRIAGAVLGLVLLVFLLAAGALVYLQTPAGRAWVRARLNDALASSFRGRMVIEEIREVGLSGVVGARVTMKDPDGEQVLFADGVRIRLPVLKTAYRALSDSKNIDISVDEVDIDYADVSLEQTATGELRLANAFEPPPRAGSEESGGEFRIAVNRVRLTHAWAHGRLNEQWIDADVDNAEANLSYVAETFALTVDRADLATRAAPRGADVSARVRGTLRIAKGTLAADVDLVGSVRSIPVSAAARLEDEAVDGTLRIGPAQPDELRRLVPSLEPRGSVTVEARVQGSLESMAIELDGEVLDAGGRVDGRVNAAARVRPSPLDVEGAVEVERLNLAALDQRLPPSRITGHGTVWTEGEAIAFQLALAPSRVNKTQLAPARLRGRLENEQLTVTGRVGPERAAADVHLVADLGAKRARAHIQARQVELSRLTDRRGTIIGTASADADVRASWAGTLSVDGHVKATGRNLAISGLYVGQADLVANARLAGRKPIVDVTLRATSVASGSMYLHRLEARAQGPLDALRTNVSTTYDGREIAATGRVRVADGVAVEELEVRGLGDPMLGSLSVRGKRVAVAIRGQRVDVGAIATLLGLRNIEGTATVDLDLRKTGQRIDGYVVAALEQGRIGKLRNLHGHLDARIEGPKVIGDTWLTWQDIGWVDVSVDAKLGGAPTSIAAWSNATGSVTVSAAGKLTEVTTLERIGLLKPGTLPVSNLRGRVTFAAEAERDHPRHPPSITLALDTEDVALEAATKNVDRVAGRTVVKDPRWKLRGLNMHVEGAVDAETGDAELEIRVRDERGPLAWADVDADLPYRELWKNHLAGFRRPPLEWLREVPITAWVSTEKRRLADLPSVLHTEHMKGDIQVSASFDGTLAKPHATVIARSFGLESAHVPLEFPVDVVVLGDWRDRRADAHVKLFAPRYQMFDARAQIDADLAAVLTGRPQDKPWKGFARATFCELPLDGLAMIAGRRIQGSAKGQVVLEDLNLPTARLDGEVQLTKLMINDVRYPSGDVRLALRDGSLRASAILRQEDKGWGRARADMPVRWTKALPELTDDGPAHIVIDASNFRMAAIQPFVDNVFVELDGSMSAKARLELRHPPHLEGNLSVHNGRFQLASFGEEFFGTRARVRFTKGGRILLDKFVAHSIGGRVEANGEARFDGTTLKQARLALRVPHNRKIPVLIDGEHYADASGRVDVTARPHDHGVRVDVNVPSLHAMLAERNPHSLQKLQKSRNVHIGMQRNSHFVELPLGPSSNNHNGTNRTAAAKGAPRTPYFFDIKLGDDVRVERERQLFVQLRGGAQIEITDRVRMAGAIELTKGYLEVRGRRFTVEHGKVTFSGASPSNPYISASASWRAPDGTKVYADFDGPVSSGKLTLRSDPPLSKDQILSLIVFGETDESIGGTSAGSGTGLATQAAGVGGTVVAPGLNEAIDDLTGLDVRVKTGSSPTNDPTTELELLITHELAVQFAHVLGTPRAGASPDRNYGTLDWRFKHDWSVETSIGDQGSTSLELLWHHRY